MQVQPFSHITHITSYGEALEYVIITSVYHITHISSYGEVM
jgi:hypothetical protein